MSYARPLAVTLVAVLLMAAGSNSASAQQLIYSPASPLQIVNRRDPARWLAAQKRALIDTRNARQRKLKTAYAAALRGSYGRQRRSVVVGYRYDVAAINGWFRAEMGALQAAIRPPTVRYNPRRYFPPVFSCEPQQYDNRRQEIWDPATGDIVVPPTDNVVPPTNIVVPPTPLPPAPEAGDVPSVPVPPPPTQIYEGQYNAPQVSYSNNLMARLAALRSWLSALFVQLGLTA